MTSLRLPLRLARREVWRRPGRTLLVALLVALPVAAMVLAVVVIRTDGSVTQRDKWERSYGQADATLFAGAPTDPPIVAATGDGDFWRGDPPMPDPDGPGYEEQQATEPDQVTLPAGSRVVPVARHFERVRATTGHRADVDITDLSLLDPVAMGMHDPVSGRAPKARGEVALSASLARRLAVDVGDDLVLDRPDVTFQVVGLVEPVGCLSCGQLIVAPGEIGSFPEASEAPATFLVDLPDLGEGERWRWSGEGWFPGELLADSLEPGWEHSIDDGEPVRWSMVLGAVVLVVVGIVISAAFAVGARRQLVTLGQLSASGTAPTTVRLALVLQGTVTGLIGVVAGLALATLGLIFGRGLIERILDERITSYAVRFGDMALIVIIGVGAATLAALLPARTAARIPTLAALAGRRPLLPVPRRLVAWGTVTFCGGLGLLAMASVGSSSGSRGDVWMYVAILGGVAELLGACAIAPAIVARLEPLATRLRGSWRLGARSLARHRSRTGAVVSAVAAAAGLAITASALLQGMDARAGSDTSLPDDLVVVHATTYDQDTGWDGSVPADPEIIAAVQDVLPDAETFTAQAVRQEPQATPDGSGDVMTYDWWQVRPVADAGPGSSGGLDLQWLVIADDRLLDAIHAPEAVRSALEEGQAVGLTDGTSGPAVLTWGTGQQRDAVLVPSRHHLGWFGRILVSESTAAELDAIVEPLATVFRNPSPLTGAERDDVEDATFLRNQANPDVATAIDWHSPASGPTPFQVELILTGLALLFALFVVGVSLALAAAESKDERDILTIAGAPPGTLARSAGARAWLMSAIGGLMAIPIGFLPVVVFSRAEAADQWTPQFPVIFPTRTVLTLLVVVPAIVALASWATSATAQRLRPVRVSTATFE